MTKTITITIPARSVKLSREVKKFPARTKVVMQDDAGLWSTDLGGKAYPITEAEAIDICRKGTNWEDVRREHFPMAGFHA